MYWSLIAESSYANKTHGTYRNKLVYRNPNINKTTLKSTSICIQNKLQLTLMDPRDERRHAQSPYVLKSWSFDLLTARG